MQEQLSQIDLSISDALKEIKDEQVVLDGRVKAMDDMKGNVAEQVYLRVRSDYMARRDTLEAKARPLREQAREHYARLGQILATLEADHEAIRLDREEINLRHQLGEFDSTEHGKRLVENESRSREKGEWLAKAQEYKARFIDSVHSEDDLKSAAKPAPRPAPAPAPAPAPVAAAPAPAPVAEPTIPDNASYRTDEFARPAELDQIPQAAPPAPAPPQRATPAPPPAFAESGTLVMPALKMPPAPAPSPPPTTSPPPPADNGSTVVFRPGRLVPQNPEAGKTTYAIALKPMNIGSDTVNDIRIGGPGVEPRHAQIAATVQGYVIVDFDTKHGTRVNAERVREKLLVNEDVIQIGPARYIFRTG